ncbi:MAG: hypothetical protein A2506_01285 [Elusimicrobia bacterium RIFOXYD12_FULL_66_9]|nr:MAG: hypothetical protein A2506_01285 [Elusimicrobia bacterium RIFOXYD12_FULL_66_9]
MDIKLISLAALLTVLSGCAGHQETARIEPIAPPSAPSLGTPLEPLLLEPLGCPVYGGEDRPGYDAQTLDCIVKWMGQAREYLAKDGKPTKYTSKESFERNRETAQMLNARISKWLSATRFDASSNSDAQAGLDKLEKQR